MHERRHLASRELRSGREWWFRGAPGRIVMMPTSRGSCTGSGVLLELLLNGHAPAALLFRAPEDILTLGALIAGRMFGKHLAVLRLNAEEYEAV